MAQSNPVIAVAPRLAVVGKAVLAMTRTCSPRARAVRRRLDEIAGCGPSISVIGATWADVRRIDPACSPWALAA